MRSILEQYSVTTSQQQSWALAIINLSIKDDIIPHIFHLNSPKEVWNILKKLYESTRTYKLFLLKSTFYKLNMQETYNMSNSICC